jgi:hypothetical protein
MVLSNIYYDLEHAQATFPGLPVVVMESQLAQVRALVVHTVVIIDKRKGITAGCIG